MSAPGALDAGKDFHGDFLFVEPAVAASGLDHGVLTADVVCAEGLAEGFSGLGNHVQEGEGGLDHDYVGAFLDVQFDFEKGLTGIAGVHLVGASVSERWGGLGGVPEGSVERGGVLGGVGHDGGEVEVVAVKDFAD